MSLDIINVVLGIFIGGMGVFITSFIYINKEIRQIQGIIESIRKINESLEVLFEHKEEAEPLLTKLSEKCFYFEKKLDNSNMEKNKIQEIEKILVKISSDIKNIDDKLGEHSKMINEIKDTIKSFNNTLNEHTTWIKIHDSKG